MRTEKRKTKDQKPICFDVDDQLLERHEISLMYLLIRRNKEKARDFLRKTEAAAKQKFANLENKV